MCTQPISIKNPNFRSKVDFIRRTKNTEDSYIEVPCGHCYECNCRKQSDFLQRVQMESLRSHIYMFTLTYNQAHVPTFELDTGVKLTCPNYHHITDMFKRIRRHKYFGDRYFKYLVCSEYGKKGRIHYHGLLFLEKKDFDTRFTQFSLEPLVSNTLLLEWRVNVATREIRKTGKRYKQGTLVPDNVHPVYESLCTLIDKYVGNQRKRTFDCHAVTAFTSKGANDVSFYVTKYMFKDSPYQKYILKCCFECYPEDKVMAMKLYTEVFKCFNRHSLNFGNVFTQESFQEARKSRCKLALTYSDDFYRYLLSCVRFSRVNGVGIQWQDLYTGKFMPICDYFLRNLSQEDQIFHFESLKKADLLRPYNARKERDRLHRSSMTRRTYKNADKPDLFDDDLLST